MQNHFSLMKKYMHEISLATFKPRRTPTRCSATRRLCQYCLTIRASLRQSRAHFARQSLCSKKGLLSITSRSSVSLGTTSRRPSWHVKRSSQTINLYFIELGESSLHGNLYDDLFLYGEASYQLLYQLIAVDEQVQTRVHYAWCCS